MSVYEGLSGGLRTRIRVRDQHRCRWCGRTDQSTDPHHIRYRRGASDDVEENLILLCRRCHDFVHGAPTASGITIAKDEAQEILWALIDLPGVTGAALRRQRQRSVDALPVCEHGKPGKCGRCLETRRKTG